MNCHIASRAFEHSWGLGIKTPAIECSQMHNSREDVEGQGGDPMEGQHGVLRTNLYFASTCICHFQRGVGPYNDYEYHSL